MCVELFTLPHFILSFPMKTTVSSIHLIAAIIIQQSTALSDSPSLGSTYPPKHCSAINAIIIITTYIIRQFHCTNSLGIFSISWVKVINSCQKPTLLKYHGCLRCISKIWLPNTAKWMRSRTRNPPIRLITNNTGSYSELHQCTFPILKETINQSKVPCIWEIQRDQWRVNTFAASYLITQGLNNSCLKSPASTLVDPTFQSRALRSFSLNQLRNLSL